MIRLEKRDQSIVPSVQSQQTWRDAAPRGMQISCWTLPQNTLDTKVSMGLGQTYKVTQQTFLEG